MRIVNMPKWYPRGVREFVDQDYTDRLSPEEQAWMDRFNEEFYGASFTDTPLHTDPKQRRDIYAEKNQRNQDIYGQGLRAGTTPEAADEHEERLWTGDPHLDDPRYRTALAAFRAQLPTDRRENPSYSPAFLRAQAEIDAVTQVKTRHGGRREERMAKTRLNRLVETRENYWDLGLVVARAEIPGREAPRITELLKFLEALVSKYDEKLKALGWVATVERGGPTPKESK